MPTVPDRPETPPAPNHVPPQPSGPPLTAHPQTASRRRVDLQGWGTMITAVVGVVTLGAGFAGGFFTQSQVGEARPQPTATVTVTVPGPTVTVAADAAAPGAGGAARPGASPTVNPLPSGVASSPSADAHRVLSASPDAGKGGSKAVLTGTGFTPGDVVRISFVVKDPELSPLADVKVRDLRDTMPDSTGAFSVEVLIPTDLDGYSTFNTYLRAKNSKAQSETVFDLTR
ncbi:hypothetical protein [Kitasatospora camelliae]|uniref:Uncharacterized protein n=1 Tax=Kitasatospora camelliae TaxID=3156397 RepID=A0AAU8JRG3_9ACTN